MAAESQSPELSDMEEAMMEMTQIIDDLASVIAENSTRLGKLEEAVTETHKKLDVMQTTLSTMEYAIGDISRIALKKPQPSSSNGPIDFFAPMIPNKPQVPDELVDIGRSLMSPIKFPKTPKRRLSLSSATTTPRKHGTEDKFNSKQNMPSFGQPLLFNNPLDYDILQGATAREGSARTQTMGSEEESVAGPSASKDKNATENPPSPSPSRSLLEHLCRRVQQSPSLPNPRPMACMPPHRTLHLPRQESSLRISRSAASMEEEKKEGDNVDVTMIDKWAHPPSSSSSSSSSSSEDGERDGSEL